MKLVIDIPKRSYNQIKKYWEENGFAEAVYYYIATGTPLEEYKSDDTPAIRKQRDVTKIMDLPEPIRDRIQDVFDQKIKISKRVTNGAMLTLLFGEILVSEDKIRDEVILTIEDQYKVVFNRTWFYSYYQYKGAADE